MATKKPEATEESAEIRQRPSYEVRRTDPGGLVEDHANCEFLIVDLTHADKASLAAVKAFADALSEAGDAEGAKEVRDKSKAKFKPGMHVLALEAVTGDKVQAVLVRRANRHAHVWTARPVDPTGSGISGEFLVKEADLEMREA